MAVDLHSQAIISIDEARQYLQDNGAAVSSGDMLVNHINGITALMLVATGRSHLKHVDDDTITEMRDGNGTNQVWTREAPIQTLTTVTLSPYRGDEYEITGPGDTAYNSEMLYDANSGMIELKNRTFPSGNSMVLLTYEAGYLSTSPELMGLKLIALEALATKWNRYAQKKQGVSSETRGEYSVTYSAADFAENAMKEMRRYRRNTFA